jgi:hypothetical protein
MKKYCLIVCALGANALSPMAMAGIARAEDRPRAARVDTTEAKDRAAQAAQLKETAKGSPATEKTNPSAGNRVHMGPTTVTVIDEGEAIDDVVSRVRQSRIERLRQDDTRKETKERPLDRTPEFRRRREFVPVLKNEIHARREEKKLNDRADEQNEKEEGRVERRDEASDKRDERLERFKEKREERNQADRAARSGRTEK